MFKCKVLKEFERCNRVLKKGSIILLSGWMFNHSKGCVLPIKWIRVQKGFNCSLKTRDELITERNNRLKNLEIQKEKIENKYQQVIDGLEN